jgi:hypothetical protein
MITGCTAGWVKVWDISEYTEHQAVHMHRTDSAGTMSRNLPSASMDDWVASLYEDEVEGEGGGGSAAAHGARGGAGGEDGEDGEGGRPVRQLRRTMPVMNVSGWRAHKETVCSVDFVSTRNRPCAAVELVLTASTVRSGDVREREREDTWDVNVNDRIQPHLYTTPLGSTFNHTYIRHIYILEYIRGSWDLMWRTHPVPIRM